MYQERSLVGSADALAAHLDEAISKGSVSASIEHQGELAIGDARMILRTYERYSMMGGNRVTLSVSILAVGDAMEVALTTSGGSEAVFFKINTFGESAFMDKGLAALDAFTARYPPTATVKARRAKMTHADHAAPDGHRPPAPLARGEHAPVHR